MQVDENFQRNLDKLYEVLEHPGIAIQRKKIEHKLTEAEVNPGDLKVLADCLVAILLIGKNWGYSARKVLSELERVTQELTQRDWKKMPDGTHQAFM